MYRTHIAAFSEPLVNRDMFSRRGGGRFELKPLSLSLPRFRRVFRAPAPDFYVSHPQIFISTRPALSGLIFTADN